MKSIFRRLSRFVSQGLPSAGRRYVASDPSEMCWISDQIMQGAEKHGKHAELGDLLVVRIDMERGRAILDIEQPAN